MNHLWTTGVNPKKKTWWSSWSTKLSELQPNAMYSNHKNYQTVPILTLLTFNKAKVVSEKVWAAPKMLFRCYKAAQHSVSSRPKTWTTTLQYSMSKRQRWSHNITHESTDWRTVWTPLTTHSYQKLRRFSGAKMLCRWIRMLLDIKQPEQGSSSAKIFWESNNCMCISATSLQDVVSPRYSINLWIRIHERPAPLFVGPIWPPTFMEKNAGVSARPELCANDHICRQALIVSCARNTSSAMASLTWTTYEPQVWTQRKRHDGHHGPQNYPSFNQMPCTQITKTYQTVPILTLLTFNKAKVVSEKVWAAPKMLFRCYKAAQHSVSSRPKTWTTTLQYSMSKRQRWSHNITHESTDWRTVWTLWPTGCECLVVPVFFGHTKDYLCSKWWAL